ncbi:polysaccharide deacetylase family protein (plasmid) [Catenovulum sp. SX2]|uniref:polysaccharide deacetylase family protein n=1 Tax=Catenovulum sp. SX2 TaxID=3398614 RepID=UPI003F8467A3
MITKIKLVLVFCLTCASVQAENLLWNGKQAAIALTYDDALNVHLDIVAPQLNQFNFKGTFYLTVASDAFRQRLAAWQQVANQGHELGNHTLFHPCRADLPNRDWVATDRDLAKWSKQQLINNLKIANTTLTALTGKNTRSFAYTCGDTTAGKDNFIQDIKPLFSGARGVHYQLTTPNNIDRYNMPAYVVHGQTLAQLTEQVDQAIKQQALLIFLFHGVGGEHGLNIDADTHLALLEYIRKHQQQLWVAPVHDIAEFISSGD